MFHRDSKQTGKSGYTEHLILDQLSTTNRNVNCTISAQTYNTSCIIKDCSLKTGIGCSLTPDSPIRSFIACTKTLSWIAIGSTCYPVNRNKCPVSLAGSPTERRLPYLIHSAGSAFRAGLTTASAEAFCVPRRLAKSKSKVEQLTFIVRIIAEMLIFIEKAN